MRVNFSGIFNISNETVKPVTPVQLSGVLMHPGIIYYIDNVFFNGTSLRQYVDHDAEISVEDGIFVVKKFY
jgi:hypothetical protein